MRTLAMILLCTLATHALPSDGVVGYADGEGEVRLSDARGELLAFAPMAWGPNWAWTGFQGKLRADGQAAAADLDAKLGGNGAPLKLELRAEPGQARELKLSAALTSSKDTDLTLVVLGLTAGKRFHGAGRCHVESTAGEQDLDVPFAKAGLGEAVKAFTLKDADGVAVRVAFDPPIAIPADGAARIALAKGHLAADERRAVAITVSLPAELTWYPTPDAVPADPAWEHAFEWKPTQDYDAPSAIGLADWLDAPAGKHGRVRRDGDQLLVDGKPAKFWGINNCYGACSPDKELAEKRAKLYAKYGVNAVRLHKFADGHGWAGIQSADSFTELDPAGLDRMDWLVAKYKERGIYVELSATFGVGIGPADLAAVPYAEEFEKLAKGKNAQKGQRIKTGAGSIFLGRELQDLMIKQTQTLLAHKNPYTGLTYAEEPSVLAIELFNEDSVLFYNTIGVLQKVPTLRKRAAAAFTEWLAKRYGDEAGLLKAWGPDALNSFGHENFTGESFAEKTIVPAGNPWFYDPDQLEGSQKAKKARLLDTMQFLYELQNDFWKRYSEALRAAGYQGEMLASNWQAGRAMSHYYNLHSDWLIGLIDRHNYFGGAGSMLAHAGSGILSSGLQQCVDRPFMLSEWISTFPNEWGVEGPAIIGAYGLGLQGWDASFLFQNGDNGGFIPQLGEGWAPTAPNFLGVFPAVARQVLRGDVKPATATATRHVDVAALHDGKVGFDDKVAQEGDVKSLDSSVVTARALAAARCVVEFTDQFRETPRFDLAPFEKEGAIVSSTGELRWTEAGPAGGGRITIDSPATKAVVGFAEGACVALGDVTIAPKSRFAAIYVTAEGRDEQLATAKRLLVVAIGRVRNTGMKFVGDHLIVRGKDPILVEPIVADITLARPGKATVSVCDQDGRRTDATLPVNDGRFTIDGATSKTIYYEVSYDQ
jgi:hypothetical protein